MLESLIHLWLTNLFLMLDGLWPIVQQLFSITVIPKTKGRSIQHGATLKCFAASAAVKGAINARGQ